MAQKTFEELKEEKAKQYLDEVAALGLPVRRTYYMFCPGGNGDELMIEFERPLDPGELPVFDEYYKKVPKLKEPKT